MRKQKSKFAESDLRQSFEETEEIELYFYVTKTFVNKVIKFKCNKYKH